MKIEGVSRYAIELADATLGVAPEALDPIDVALSFDELILAMFDAQMLLVADIHQAVVASPAVAMNDDVGFNFASNNSLKRLLRAIRDDLGVDPAVTFEDAEDNGLAAGPAASLAANPTRTEVALVDLHLAAFERPTILALSGQTFAQEEINIVDGTDADAADPRRIRGREVQGEQPKNLAETGLTELGAFVVAVSHGSTEVKSTSAASFAS